MKRIKDTAAKPSKLLGNLVIISRYSTVQQSSWIMCDALHLSWISPTTFMWFAILSASIFEYDNSHFVVIKFAIVNFQRKWGHCRRTVEIIRTISHAFTRVPYVFTARLVPWIMQVWKLLFFPPLWCFSLLVSFPCPITTVFLARATVWTQEFPSQGISLSCGQESSPSLVLETSFSRRGGGGVGKVSVICCHFRTEFCFPI